MLNKLSRATCVLTFCVFTSNAASLVVENFSDPVAMQSAGWIFQNNSNPAGAAGWAKGNAAAFAAQDGSPDGFVGVGFGAVGGVSGNASAWLISPLITFAPYQTATFYTRTDTDNGAYPDRMEVRASTGGSNVGATDSSVGDFTTLILTVNPALLANGYPNGWTAVSFDVSGFGGPARLAFRYSVPDITKNGDYIGLDSLSVQTATPEPVTSATMLAGLGVLAVMARRKRAGR